MSFAYIHVLCLVFGIELSSDLPSTLLSYILPVDLRIYTQLNHDIHQRYHQRKKSGKRNLEVTFQHSTDTCLVDQRTVMKKIYFGSKNE